MGDSKLVQKILQSLFDLEALRVRPSEPFRWSSGILSPIYCDNRVLLSAPETRKWVLDALQRLVEPHLKVHPTLALVGVATAGIPYAAALSERLNTTFLYVRPQAKAHGLQKSVEGIVKKGQPCLLVEDVVSTAGSLGGAAQRLRDAGLRPQGAIAVLNYGFALAEERLRKEKLGVAHVFSYQDIRAHEGFRKKVATVDLKAEGEHFLRQQEDKGFTEAQRQATRFLYAL